jgi:hypothetical protein
MYLRGGGCVSLLITPVKLATSPVCPHSFNFKIELITIAAPKSLQESSTPKDFENNALYGGW